MATKGRATDGLSVEVGKMIKIFCDKCGKEVDEFEAYTILVEAPEIKSWADQYMYERRGYQVCRDCMAEIATFIEPRTTE